MKLIFDCRFIRLEHHDGISRFSAELFRALSTKTEVTALISNLDQLSKLPAGTNYILANEPTNAIAELRIPLLLNAAGASHVFSPMQTIGSVGRKYKLVLTLHDLIYYSHPKAPPALALHVRIAWRMYHLNFAIVRLLLNRADAVVTVSNTSKQLIEQKRLTHKPVHVIYNAPDDDFASLVNQNPQSLDKRNQLIYMGSFMPYKNVETLVRAMKLLPEHELVLLSKISRTRKAELQALAQDAANRIIFRDGVSDSEYAEALIGGFALVTASKDEGFGIPLVEAMAQGLPIVVSDIPIFREVAEGAGQYFDSSSPESVASVVESLSNAHRWKNASSQALRRAAFFDWDASADALLRVLKDL